MATEAPSTDEVRCSHHPNTLTRLRCSRCGKPICPQCSVRTPVGLRCPECAGVRGLPTYPTGLDALVKAAGIGLVLAIAIGYIWSRYPDWGFYLALVLGFSIAESMAWAVKGKRGVDLQVVGIVLVAFALVFSRWLLFRNFNLVLSDYSQLSPLGKEVLHVKLIPDGLFAALPLLIVWYRFR
jgi:hypothetical protein